jgi:choline kinase|tara:strand:- start:762 stop:1469 length:708 start_codon:yes stop_codon:yes gene_type:complete
MKAFILAAGVSRRLYPHTYDLPKCLLDVGGKPIINYQLEAIEDIGVTEVTMVVGYHREMLINHVTTNFPGLSFNFIINHHYFETNTAYSLYLGRKVLDSDLMLMNADVIYPIDLLKKIFLSDYETALAVDIKSCGQEEVKVIDGGNNKIVAIGKKLIEKQCLGEFIGVAKLSLDFNYHFSQALSDLIKAGGNDNYFEAAIHLLLDKTDIRYVDVSEYPCLEIDFIEDLNSARKLF